MAKWSVYKEHHGLNQWTYWLDCDDKKICQLTEQQYEAVEQLQAENEKQAEEIEQLEAELDKHRWIPVSERLPEGTEPVLIFLPCLYTSIDRYSTKHQEWETSDGERATHWKPIILPEQALKK